MPSGVELRAAKEESELDVVAGGVVPLGGIGCNC